MKYQLWMVLSRKGKIKHIGLSNENAWGIMRFFRRKPLYLPCKTIQNPYSLLNRLFENASSEICIVKCRFIGLFNRFGVLSVSFNG
jgi:aryl-alcohol dehydrogenase-like predicted oxidoreductase